MTTMRYIDTTRGDLEEGDDVADLVQRGISGDMLVAWCKAHLVDGPPPAPQKKTPSRGADRERALVALPGGASGQEAGGSAAEAKPSAPPADAPAAPAGNVVPMRKPKVEAPDPDAIGVPAEYSDDALATAFANEHCDKLVYVHAWGRWMQWDGARWRSDDTMQHMAYARAVCRAKATEAQARPDLGRKGTTIAGALGSSRTMSSLVAVARYDRKLAASATQWDADDWLLNTPSGVVDLRTGAVRPARRDDFCTKMTRVAPGGECPTWRKFLRRVTGGDYQLEIFMQRVAGYCLTGSTRDHAMFFVWGEGGNGKGTFLNTLTWILDDYARTANMSTFTEQKFDGHPTEIAMLQGARMVTAQETSEGKRWAEERIKSLTGGDLVSARFMRQDSFEFMPKFKLVFTGNHKPHLRNVDEAIKRRLFMVPFDQKIPDEEKDRRLSEKLRAEASGILQWMIEGCMAWQEHGLAAPDRVRALTDEYFAANDTIGQFIGECCEVDKLFNIRSATLYARFSAWCRDRNEFPVQQRRFTELLKMHGMEPCKINGHASVRGLRLVYEPSDDERRAERASWGLPPQRDAFDRD